VGNSMEEVVDREPTPNFPLTVVVLLIAFLISITLFLQTVSQKIIKRRVLPPGPWKLPIIGNLHQMLYGNLLPHHRLTELATIYGPLMHLQLGEVSTVVVSSAELAKEFLQTKDINFSTRPCLPSAYTIFYQGRDIVFGNGDYWKQMRKIFVQELLAPNRVKSLLPTIEAEVDQLVTSIRSSSGSTINIGGMIVSLGTSLISRTVFGKIQKHSDSFYPIKREIIRAVEGSNLWDLFPSSYLVRLLTNTESKLKKLHNEVDVVLQTIIDDHIAARSVNNDIKAHEDIVDVLLNYNLRQDLQIRITNNDIKAVLLDIFIGGDDTSSSTIEWALTELMRNSQIMKKVQKEVRDQFDGKRRIDYEDVDQLYYFKLVIKETLRLHTPAPLIPREARESTMIHGYHIPAKTRIIVNAWAIAHDHHNWHEPENFYPERFRNDLSSNADYFKAGLDFSLIPFGSGRRICPGVQFGMAVVALSLANLLYYFDWKLPPSTTSQNLDMSEDFGISVKKQKDLFLIAIPYHPKDL
ncbi:Premnaspirodiene oxygenase, partial [Linum grandiflorum]